MWGEPGHSSPRNRSTFLEEASLCPTSVGTSAVLLGRRPTTTFPQSRSKDVIHEATRECSRNESLELLLTKLSLSPQSDLHRHLTMTWYLQITTHLFSIHPASTTFRVAGGLEPDPADFGREAGSPWISWGSTTTTHTWMSTLIPYRTL